MKDYFILVVLLFCERTVKGLDVGEARVIDPINDKRSFCEDFSIFSHVVIDFRASSCQFYAAFLYKTDRQLTGQEKLEISGWW